MAETLESNEHPLAFKMRRASRPPSFDTADGDVVRVEARLLRHHQKEAVVTEGDAGCQWRLTSDEGANLNGSDLAPFPLGYFNAGLQADLLQRLGDIASEHGAVVERVELELSNHFWFTGSFAMGTGSGHAEQSRLRVHVTSTAAPPLVRSLVDAALRRSPAFALLGTPLASTFSLHVNGRHKALATLSPSPRSDVPDPFLAYAGAPRPLDPHGPRDLVARTDDKEHGTAVVSTSATDRRFMINVMGRSQHSASQPQARLGTWLQLAGATHFAWRADTAGTQSAPSGLGLLCAGVAFCFMTQLSRYIEQQKLEVGGIRLVQFTRFAIDSGIARPHGVDTHLFLNGHAPQEVQANLVVIAARTCYLHSTLAAAVPPAVELILNGQALP